MMASTYQYNQGEEEEDVCELQAIAVSASDCSSLSGYSFQASVVTIEEQPEPHAMHRTSVRLDQRTMAVAHSEPFADRSMQITDPLHLGFLRLFGLPAPVDTPATAIKREVMLDKSEVKVVCIKPNTILSRITRAVSEATLEPVHTNGSRENLREDHVDETATPTFTDCNMAKTEAKPPPSLMETLQFEVVQTGTAAPAFVCYCIANLTIYELIYGALLELTDVRVTNFMLLYLGLMALGLLMLRCTGFLWYFLPGRQYRRSRREMKHRQPWDAKVSEWLEEKPTLNTVLNVVGFYLCYISVYYFWNQFMTHFIDQRGELFKLLPSTQHYNRVVRDSLGILSESTNGTREGSCNVSEEWDVADYEFLYSNVAKASYYQYSGSTAAPLYRVSRGVLVLISSASVSIYFLSTVGFAFSDSW
jgi:hypothetical protein